MIYTSPHLVLLCPDLAVHRAVQTLALDNGFRWAGDRFAHPEPRHGGYLAGHRVANLLRLIITKKSWEPPIGTRFIFHSARHDNWVPGTGVVSLMEDGPINLNDLVTWLTTDFVE